MKAVVPTLQTMTLTRTAILATAEEFVRWIVDELQPQCQQCQKLTRSALVLENASWHVNDRVRQVVERMGC